MTSTLAPFVDTETVLMNWLESTFAELAADGSILHVVNVGVPNTLEDYPFVRVMRIGGSDNRFTDFPRVDVEVFSPSRQTAYALAEAIRARLLGYPIPVSGGLIDRVRTETAPFRAPWADPKIHRYLATYQLSARR